MLSRALEIHRTAIELLWLRGHTAMSSAELVSRFKTTEYIAAASIRLRLSSGWTIPPRCAMISLLLCDKKEDGVDKILVLWFQHTEPTWELKESIRHTLAYDDYVKAGRVSLRAFEKINFHILNKSPN